MTEKMATGKMRKESILSMKDGDRKHEERECVINERWDRKH